MYLQTTIKISMWIERRYKIRIQNPFAFLYSRNQQSEDKIFKVILFIMAKKSDTQE